MKPSRLLLIHSLFAFSQSHPWSFSLFPHYFFFSSSQAVTYGLLARWHCFNSPPKPETRPVLSCPHSEFYCLNQVSHTHTPPKVFFPQGLISGPCYSLAMNYGVHKPSRIAHQTQHYQNCYKCHKRASVSEFLPEISVLQKFQSF